MRIVNELMTARMRQFEYLVTTELPILFDQFGFDKKMRDAMQGYVQKLQDWLSGVLFWHKTVNRYKEFELRHDAQSKRKSALPTGLSSSTPQLSWQPTGIGTSITRLNELFNNK